jgi:hypothetical protein
MAIITPQEFNFDEFSKIRYINRHAGNQGTSVREKYLDIVTAFDIETTRIREIEQSIMYVWQWHFDGIATVVGRTWEEFRVFVARLKSVIRSGCKLVVYVHNLSYEFQFLRGIYEFQPDDVFAVESRKVLKATMMDTFEFRCSYLHSNMSLAVYTEKMGVEHKKLDGIEFDYNKQRFPWTPLSDKELEYCTNDVIGLTEALKKEMQVDNDNLYTIPLTSTGYVRRDARKAMRQAPKGFVKEQLPDFEVYTALREAFRGGNTHANRLYVGKTLENVSSADRSSSYPDVQCNCKFPVRQFQRRPNATLADVEELVFKRKRAVLMRVAFDNIKLRDPEWGSPYIPISKCRCLTNSVNDNGRVLKASHLQITVTDVDLRIIFDEYQFDDCYPIGVWSSTYGYLPQPLIDTTISYYVAKTSLKGLEGQEIYYMKGKNKLNSIYGMCAQDPVKQSIHFMENSSENPFSQLHDDPKEILEEHNKHAFLCYQWGVWVTSWARKRLEEGIKLAGHNFVYCDTDSVKYLGDVDWTNYNQQRIADSTRSGAHATDPKGNEHYMGVFEFEGIYEKFKTLGSKKYLVQKAGEPVEATIAGVAKDVWGKDVNGNRVLKKMGGGAELSAAGGFDAFKPGFIFSKAGGTESVYNDKPPEKWYQVDGNWLEITPNIVIRDSEYTLGITAEYEAILSDPIGYWDVDF